MYADDLSVQISFKNTALVNNLWCDCNSVINIWTTAKILCLTNNKTQSTELSLRLNR